MYHAAWKVEFQPFTVVLTIDVFQLLIKYNLQQWCLRCPNVECEEHSAAVNSIYQYSYQGTYHKYLIFVFIPRTYALILATSRNASEVVRTGICVGYRIESFDIWYIEISNFRYTEISNVFCPPSTGIPVFLMQIQQYWTASMYITDTSIKYRNLTYRLPVVFYLSRSYRTPFRYRYPTLTGLLQSSTRSACAARGSWLAHTADPWRAATAPRQEMRYYAERVRRAEHIIFTLSGSNCGWKALTATAAAGVRVVEIAGNSS